MNQQDSRAWAIVLAAGEGTRLSSITTDPNGLVTPKQFCSLGGGNSLLGDAIERAARLVARERIVVIVATQHERWWSRELATILPENRIVQPANKGTAAGVLLPLLSILGRDPAAHIALVPSDHYIERESLLLAAMREGLAQIGTHAHGIVLLGVAADGPDTEYGWIVPRTGDAWPARVEAFVEKPSPPLAARLFEEGALWNSFLLVASAKTLIARFHEHMPDLLAAFLNTTLESSADLAALYERLAVRDFSRDLLQGREEDLHVMPVSPCGWTDLGTPARVAACIARARSLGLGVPPSGGLALAVAREEAKQDQDRLKAVLRTRSDGARRQQDRSARGEELPALHLRQYRTVLLQDFRMLAREAPAQR